jgi:hypothetical protein
VFRLSWSTRPRTGSPGGRNIWASAARLSWDTIIDLMPHFLAQAPVHRSVVRSDTSSRSGSRSSSSWRSEFRAVIARYPPVPGTGTPGTVMTSPCSVSRRSGRGPGTISTGLCPAAR